MLQSSTFHRISSSLNSLNFLALLSLSTTSLQAQITSNELVINEVLASNIETETINLETPDLIELRNLSDQPIDLSSYQLSDDPSDIAKWSFPVGTVIPANGFLTIIANCADEDLQTNFRLNAAGETLVLSDPTGTLIQELAYPRTRGDISYGRLDDDGSYAFFTNVTIGNANDDNNAINALVRRPQTDLESGLFPTGTNLTVTLSAEPDTVIHFTTDDSEPTESSEIYTGAIPINQTTVLKSIAIESSTGLVSDIASRSFIFTDADHTLPVVIITADDFSAEPTGLYNNFVFDGRVRFDFLETDGSLPVSQYAEFRPSGRTSRARPLFNGKIEASSRLGRDNLPHRFFPEKSADRFEQILLRGASQDFSQMRIRDGIISRLISEDNLVDAEHEGFRPAVAYVNGNYAGHINIREDDDRAFVEQYFDFPKSLEKVPDSVSLTRAPSVPYRRAATLPDRNSPDAIVRANSILRMDEAILDGLLRDAFNAFEESVYWTSGEPGQVQRTSLHDYDFVFGIRDSSLPDVWSAIGWERGADNFPMDGENTRFWHDAAQSAAAFLHLFAYPERVIGMIDQTAAEIRDEMPRTIQLYLDQRVDQASTFTTSRSSLVVADIDEWEGEIDFARNFVTARLTGSLDALAATHNFTILDADIRSENTAMGDVAIQGYKVSAGREQGRYFSDLPLRLEALPKPGYQFAGWQGDVPAAEQGNAYVEVSLTSSSNITATFIPVTTLAISEIFYNPVGPSEDAEFIELTNFGDSDIDISGVSFTDGINYTFPPNTILAAGEYITLNNTQYTGALSNGGETLALANASGDTIESFTYDDSAPWPELADGDGRSLVRIAPGNDDPNLASAWRISSLEGGNPSTNDSLPLVDNSPDGLLEYAFGASIPSFGFTRDVDNNLNLNFNRIVNADAVSVSIMTSTDLSTGTWQEIPQEQAVSSAAAGNGQVIFSVQIPTTEPMRFYRLAVEER